MYIIITQQVTHIIVINVYYIFNLASHLWTQQDLVQMVSVDTKEAIPLPKDIRDEVLNSVVIWLVTMNKNETSATHVYLQRLDDKYVYKHIDQKTEDITYYIGKYGAYPAALCNVPPDFKSDGGTSISKITYGLFRNIIVVINVGVVCGIENKVKMCDVLVSSEIVNYDKVGVRGETITVSPRLTRLFTQSINMWPYTLNIQKRLNDNEMVMPVVKSGIILSGPHLAEDQVIKTAIPENIASEPIGIEMEGIYPFTQTQLTMTNVITVKAVCDFGDGQNNEIYQPTAALLAADLVHECLKSDQAHEIFEGLYNKIKLQIIM